MRYAASWGEHLLGGVQTLGYQQLHAVHCPGQYAQVLREQCGLSSSFAVCTGTAVEFRTYGMTTLGLPWNDTVTFLDTPRE